MKPTKVVVIAALAVAWIPPALSQNPPSPLKLKDETRQLWRRSDENFIRSWTVTSAMPGRLEEDCFLEHGGESGLQPDDSRQQVSTRGTKFQWRSQVSWADEVSMDGSAAAADVSVVYAFAKVTRAAAGKALLSLGSTNGVRVWVNGVAILTRDGVRPLIPDEDQAEVPMQAGANTVLVKGVAGSRFCLRILEPGTVLSRREEITPSLIKYTDEGFTLKADAGPVRSTGDVVKVEVVMPGGTSVFDTTMARGAEMAIDAGAWPDGPYEVRCSSRTFTGRLYSTHIPWYKGDFRAKARELESAAAVADALRPEGFTLKMLASMVEDRLGGKVGKVKGNPWQKVHSPLMEFDEMMLEQKGKVGRIRPHGFVRLAYRDEVDGSPQFCRAYLPADYDPAKKWPVVIQLHGYNPANPVYIRWWAADERHSHNETEFADHQGVIYLEPHGRGNTWYLRMGDKDIMTVIAEAKRLFNVDENRIYLTGDSMGGWGTWNIGCRHPDLFAAIAPVFGGTDYHAQLAEEQLAQLTPLERFLAEKRSSWSMGDGLLNMPIFVHHGDADMSVPVEYSRYGVRLLQRWGYNIRYREYPGRGHEALESGFGNGGINIEWFLQHRRNPDPRHVRLRSAELRNASAYWVRALQSTSPLAFMVADAEVIDANLIRLDTENILDIQLTPSDVLVDRSRPVTVVWNGVRHDVDCASGVVHLRADGYAPAAVHKNDRLPGPIADLLMTPFAVVVGTVSKDPAMVTQCREKAQLFVDSWKEWQKQPPRVFDDTEMGDEDIAKYSLLLFGGPDANSVTAGLAAVLPLQVASDRVAIDGQAFSVKDAAVQMIYPHPRNPERYLMVAAGTSPNGMYFCDVNPQVLDEWDYFITDGVIPARGQRASQLRIRVVSGMFDANWRFSEVFAHRGDEDVRRNGRLRLRPDERFSLSTALLDSYAGKYQITNGPVVEIFRKGKQLHAKMGGAESAPMIPQSETMFSLPRQGVWMSFHLDQSGKVIGFDAYQDGSYEATRIP